MEERGRVVGDYMLEERIGSGSFAVVWRARHRQSGAEVAVKEIDKMKVDGKFREGLLKEITILRSISHPNIVRLYQAIQTEDRVFLVLEYCTGGDLTGYIQQHSYRGRVSEAVARHFMKQLASGLQALRENNLIHRDLKPQVKRLISEETKQAKILAYITALKKLCNHPKLIYDTIKNNSSGTTGFEDCMRFFPPELFSGRSGSWTGGGGMWVELSGKMHVLARLLGHLRQRTNDRIVLVSNYTQTLDLFAQLCRERRYAYVRLDGSTSISDDEGRVRSGKVEGVCLQAQE